MGANVIMWQLVTGEQRYYIIRCYLAPGYGVTIEDVEVVITKKPRGAGLIVLGGLNVDL